MIKYLEKEEEFESLTKEKCLVDFYADWCGPCRMMGEVIEDLTNTDNTLRVLKINADKFPELSMKFGVMSIPTLILMENSKEIKKSIGYISKEQLVEFLK